MLIHIGIKRAVHDLREGRRVLHHETAESEFIYRAEFGRLSEAAEFYPSFRSRMLIEQSLFSEGWVFH